MTTAAPQRIRRSVRFAQLDQATGAAGQEKALRRERMSMHPRLEMPSFQNTQDWTGTMGMSPSGRFQVVEEKQPAQKPFTRAGIRMDWAKAILWVLAAVLSVTLLVTFASIGASSLRIRKLETRIGVTEDRARSLETELGSLSGDISVVTRAVGLNLISSGGAQTIRLVAPEHASLTLVQTPAAQVTEEPEMRASSGSME